MKMRFPNLITVFRERDKKDFYAAEARWDDIHVWVEGESELNVKAQAAETPLCYIRLRWNFSPDETPRFPARVTGDDWERGYGKMQWSGISPNTCYPWVIACSNGSDANRNAENRWTACWGVKVRPSALAFWQYDTHGVTLWLDARNGGAGVILRGRTLDAATVVCAEYENITAFRALRAFYRTLVGDAILPKRRLYGANNWYYAYGRSSEAEILTDARLIAELSEGLPVKPYSVIDAGWSDDAMNGPWDHGNERFPDMRALAEKIRAAGAEPGIWVRYLADEKGMSPIRDKDAHISRDAHYLDPSHPAVLEEVKRITHLLSEEWGYTLIKHDFSTVDIFGEWGFQRPFSLTNDGWTFYDRSLTSAEIVVRLYRAILEAAKPGTLILGCNVIGHLAAGLVHANRTGDDTSGLHWDRTRKMGVNTLAFRMPHDGAFYSADPDCVGITGRIDWKYNRCWLDILAQSGAALFVSLKPEAATDEIKADLKRAFEINLKAKGELEPVDWMENLCPERWEKNGREICFDWIPEDGCTDEALDR